MIRPRAPLRPALAAAALLLLAACAGSGPAGPVLPALSPPAAQRSAAALVRSLPLRPTFLAMERLYPEEARAFRADVAEILTRPGTEAQRRRQMTALGAAFRKRHAAGVRHAPRKALEVFLDGHIAALGVVEADEAACYDVIHGGPDAVPDRYRPEIGKVLEEVGPAAVEAMHAGEAASRTAGLTRAEPSDADYQALVDAMGREEALDVMGALSVLEDRPPGGCAASLKLLRFLRGADFPGRDRVLADLMTRVASED